MRIFTLALLTSTIFLTGCGGGGSSSSGVRATGSLDGTVAKGIISGALVTAYKPDNEKIGDDITAADGSYNISLGSYGGAVRLVLAPPVDGIALVTCDVSACGFTGLDDVDTNHNGIINFGEQYKLDYELSAVVYADTSVSKKSAHITPLTTLVAKYIQASGGVLDADHIAVANSFVKEILGLDANPDVIEPVDLTDIDPEVNPSEQQLRFALLNAAFEQLSQNSDITTVLNDLSANFATNNAPKSILVALAAAISNVESAVNAGNPTLFLSTATSVVVSDLNDAILANCVTDTCTITPDLSGTTIADNLLAAKKLVATARAVTVEALTKITDEIEPVLYQYDASGHEVLDEFYQPVTSPNPKYNPDNLISRLRAAGSLPGGELRGAVDAFSAVNAVLVFQMDKVFFDAAGSATLTTNLSQAAAESYDDDHLNNCELWYSGYSYLQTCIDNYNANRQEYLSHFVSGALAYSAGNWQAVNVIYDLDGNLATTTDRATINTAVTNLADVQFEAGVHTLSVQSTALYGNTILTLKPESTMTTTFAAGYDAKVEYAKDVPIVPNISQISLNAVAEIVNGSDTFNGNVSFTAKKSSSHKSINVDSVALAPTQMSLSGEFSDGVSKNLNASVIVALTNADQFSFYEEGFMRNDLTTYAYDANANTLTVTHGLVDNRIVVKYSLITTPSSCWDSVTSSYISCNDYSIHGEVVSTVGDANLENFWYILAFNDMSFNGYYEEVSCAGAYTSTDGLRCYIHVSAQNSGVVNDIRVAFNDPWISPSLTALEAYVPGEGYYRGLDQDPDFYYYPNPYPILFNSNSGSIPAYLSKSDFDFNAEGRYLKLNLHAETSGKLSATLPEMNITFNALRTGYRIGTADLTLKWGTELLRIDYDLSTDVDLLVHSLKLTDGLGTTMVVQRSEVDALTVGHIVKDGTIYGTITHEGGVYMITWIDNTIETLQ